MQELVLTVEPSQHQHDTKKANGWHVPKNERDYDRSPQRALWRTAKELKMDEYNDLSLFRLVLYDDVVAAGHKVLGTVWAYSIKFDKEGKFLKLNPRWCVMGGSMDRGVYDSFSDVMLRVTLWILGVLRAIYPVIDFQMDFGNAFQDTPATPEAAANFGHTVDQRTEKLPVVYYQQARGFVKYGPNGERYVCEGQMAHQGRIDSAALFRRASRTLFKEMGCRTAVWDPQLYVFHNGPTAQEAHELPDILAKCAGMPATTGAPPGWAAFGMHVDDGAGIASSVHVRDYIEGRVAVLYACKMTNWQKILGYTADIDDVEHTVTFSAYPMVKQLAEEHLVERAIIQPKMPYMGSIMSVVGGERPAQGAPDLAEYLIMESKTRSILGSGIWLSDVYPQIMWCNNHLCAFSAKAGPDVYRHATYWLMHLLAFPVPVIFGGINAYRKSLVLSDTPIPPFAPFEKELGYHQICDANLGSTGDFKAITGVVDMLGGSAIGCHAGRQQLTAPDSTTAEMVAAGTGHSRVISKRGLLQELSIPQVMATPQYIDASSVVFQAHDATAVKRAVWLRRRAAVLQEGNEDGTTNSTKIDEWNNPADAFTKVLTSEVFHRHMHYTHNKKGEPPALKKQLQAPSVVTAVPSTKGF